MPVKVKNHEIHIQPQQTENAKTNIMCFVALDYIYSDFKHFLSQKCATDKHK